MPGNILDKIFKIKFFLFLDNHEQPWRTYEWDGGEGHDCRGWLGWRWKDKLQRIPDSHGQQGSVNRTSTLQDPNTGFLLVQTNLNEPSTFIPYVGPWYQGYLHSFGF